MVMTASRSSGLPRPAARALQPPTRLQSSAGPGPEAATAALAALRATAARTLCVHARDGRRCACCHQPWPCGPAHLAATALGAG